MEMKLVFYENVVSPALYWMTTFVFMPYHQANLLISQLQTHFVMVQTIS